MKNKIIKSLSTLVLGAGLIGIGSFNSYSQDTLRNAEGYWVFNEKKQLISDVREGYNWKEVYEYDNNGKLKKLTVFNKLIKTREYFYNEKGQLTKEIAFDENGNEKKDKGK